MQMKQLCTALLVSAVCPGLMFGGTVSGKVTYTGTPAKPKTIDMSKEPSCAKQYATPPTTEAAVPGPNNALANVVVYVSAGAPDEKSAPSQVVSFTQKGCRYLPHVIVVQTGQDLKVLNEDQTSHNVHPLAKLNREWNKSQPPGSPPIVDKFDKEEFIPVKCNVHPWMRGYFAVLKTSHYAVTGEDGSFSLPNLPPGKYTITAWQESYSPVSQEVTITGNETKSLDLSIKATPY